jgi:hypothetical protein
MALLPISHHKDEPPMRYLALFTLLLLAACGRVEPAPASTPIPPTPTDDTAANLNDTDGDGVLNADDLCDGAITGASGADTNGCPDVFDPYANLTYNHQPHELWYGRFWTGSCENVPGFCLSGDPAWLTVTDEIAAEFPADEQGRIRNRLWAIGRAVGYDWSSDEAINTDKAITTGQLRRWGNALQASEDIAATLTEIEGEICTLLGEQVLEGGFTDAEACAA